MGAASTEVNLAPAPSKANRISLRCAALARCTRALPLPVWARRHPPPLIMKCAATASCHLHDGRGWSAAPPCAQIPLAEVRMAICQTRSPNGASSEHQAYRGTATGVYTKTTSVATWHIRQGRPLRLAISRGAGGSPSSWGGDTFRSRCHQLFW